MKTFIVAAILVLIVALIIGYLARQLRRGNGLCCGDCKSCGHCSALKEAEAAGCSGNCASCQGCQHGANN